MLQSTLCYNLIHYKKDIKKEKLKGIYTKYTSKNEKQEYKNLP